MNHATPRDAEREIRDLTCDLIRRLDRAVHAASHLALLTENDAISAESGCAALSLEIRRGLITLRTALGLSRSKRVKALAAASRAR